MSWKLPETTDWMKKQMAHEPTRIYAQEIYDLIKTFPYEEALEIGSCWGLSALSILLAQPKGHLTGVDSGETHFENELAQNGLTDRSTYKHMRSDAFWAENQKTYDLIYIDGSHHYRDVKPDLFEAWKVLNPNGLMIWDDAWHEANVWADLHDGLSQYGVALASWELIHEMKIEHIHTTTRLLYVYKNEQPRKKAE